MRNKKEDGKIEQKRLGKIKARIKPEINPEIEVRARIEAKVGTTLTQNFVVNTSTVSDGLKMVNVQEGPTVRMHMCKEIRVKGETTVPKVETEIKARQVEAVPEVRLQRIKS